MTCRALFYAVSSAVLIPAMALSWKALHARELCDNATRSHSADDRIGKRSARSWLRIDNSPLSIPLDVLA